MAHEKIVFTPIGYFKSSQVHPYEAGRQPDSHHATGCIQLSSGENFRQALMGLESCSRIWLIFSFHHNQHWKPMVLPPRGRDQKIGVFATRSPYRPNPVGLSCVKIKSIDQEKLKIFVEEGDLLDGSPILDIKPYVAYADAFPETEPEWLKNSQKFDIRFSEIVENQLNWLEENGLKALRGFLWHQLEYEPMNSKKKRLIKNLPIQNPCPKTDEVLFQSPHKEDLFLEKSQFNVVGPSEISNNYNLVHCYHGPFIIAYRTWRAQFTVQSLQVIVENIFSGYTKEELSLLEDPYQDKDLHRMFLKTF